MGLQVGVSSGTANDRNIIKPPLKADGLSLFNDYDNTTIRACGVAGGAPNDRSIANFPIGSYLSAKKQSLDTRGPLLVPQKKLPRFSAFLSAPSLLSSIRDQVAVDPGSTRQEPMSTTNFSDLGLSQPVLQALAECG